MAWELAAGAVRFVTVTALMLLLLILVPLWLPIVAILHWLDQRRLHASAERSACSACNQILGRQAIELADQYWDKHMAEMHKDVTMRFRRSRIVRKIHAICTHCGAQYEYVDRLRQFRPIQKEEWPG